jgi:hypothetical protein
MTLPAGFAGQIGAAPNSVSAAQTLAANLAASLTGARETDKYWIAQRNDRLNASHFVRLV